jgi:acetoin utilization protein AcuC
MTLAIAYSDKMKGYDFGPGHPFRGDRYARFMDLLRQKVSSTDFEVVDPRHASDEELLLVHDRDYLDFLRSGRARTWSPGQEFLSPDTPLQPGLEEAARLIVGAALTAAEISWTGRPAHSVGVGGGLHHARRAYGAGFCIYNDVAVCVRSLLENHGAKRVLVVDTDAHAGDGTCHMFYQDPRVLFIDIHQDPRTLYPGTGFIKEIGDGQATGFTVNVPLPPGASDDAYEYVLDQIVSPMAEEFGPEIAIRNGGSDPHFADELTDLGLTLSGLRTVGVKVGAMAGMVCQGKLVDLVGSGYNQALLPLGWLALISGPANLNLQLEEPFLFSLRTDHRLAETRDIVQTVRETLKPYWKCFAG